MIFVLSRDLIRIFCFCRLVFFIVRGVISVRGVLNCINDCGVKL